MHFSVRYNTSMSPGKQGANKNRDTSAVQVSLFRFVVTRSGT